MSPQYVLDAALQSRVVKVRRRRIRGKLEVPICLKEEKKR